MMRIFKQSEDFSNKFTEIEGKTLIGNCGDCNKYAAFGDTGFCSDERLQGLDLMPPDFGCIHWKERL